MTRWARANNVHKHKAADATPWSRLKATGGRAQGSRAPAVQLAADGRKKKKKKDYADQDVNGFLEFLQQNGHSSATVEPKELKREVEVALRKDHRRENRRIKRQTDKKSQMLCFNCRKPGHGLADCPEAERERETGAGICYRCGSAEHDIQRCRAKVDPAATTLTPSASSAVRRDICHARARTTPKASTPKVEAVGRADRWNIFRRTVHNVKPQPRA
ncbi:zinc finger CCHC domain-containing protein 9 isoform X2 [Corythoichthys intestinalis]|uniref:zinc finger CCHC domain-containing protein 9 isoform X2 n=1 Tax=Corythoichthys intestinalis TaxID=161448 RepID=UPI0025A54CB2|nr:zinc finger CCHC domain-containing protein 9 isoform X2 [Corythoichthys intestinalis]